MGKITLLSTGLPPSLLPQPHRAGDESSHVSAIVHRLAVYLGHHKDSDSPPRNKWALGKAMEWALLRAYERDDPDPERYFEPGQLTLDGLYGTPDQGDALTRRIREIKLSWMAAHHTPDSDKFWAFRVQLAAYAHMMHRLYDWECSGVLTVVHVTSYERNPETKKVTGDAEVNHWLYEWSEKELERNWRMLLENRQQAAAGAKGARK